MIPTSSFVNLLTEDQFCIMDFENQLVEDICCNSLLHVSNNALHMSII